MTDMSECAGKCMDEWTNDGKEGWGIIWKC